MHNQATTAPDPRAQKPVGKQRLGELRSWLREHALQTAMQKRAAGVPTYSVPEAAALLSISQEYLYRLIQASAFPAVRMRLGGSQGRYVVPAKAVERLLDDASAVGGCIEVSEWAQRWHADVAGGAPASAAVTGVVGPASAAGAR